MSENKKRRRKIIMQDLIFLTKPSSFYRRNPDDISWKATHLVLNRFTIDEDAAFELLGVTDAEKMNRLMPKESQHTLNLHIIYTSEFLGKTPLRESLQQTRLQTTKSYVSKQFLEKSQARSAMVTRMHMCRHFLITKEKMDDICKGQGLMKESANDDIEELFADLQLGNEPKTTSYTYFLPKLTHKEKKLAEKKDSKYLETFSSLNPSIDDDEMNSSESKSMFVRGWCTRKTYTIENPMFQDEDTSNMPSDKISIEINNSISNLDEDDIEEKSQYQQKYHNCIIECCRKPFLIMIALLNTIVELLKNILLLRPS